MPNLNWPENQKLETKENLEKWLPTIEEVDVWKFSESTDGLNRVNMVKEATDRVQREIERNQDIDPELRTRRWDFELRSFPSNNDFMLTSWWVSTFFEFIDNNTISINWDRWHDLKVRINPDNWLDSIIKVMNLMNYMEREMIKNGAIGIKIDKWDIKFNWDYKTGIRDLANSFGFGWKIIDTGRLESNWIDPEHFVKYVNESRYWLLKRVEENNKQQENNINRYASNF